MTAEKKIISPFKKSQSRKVLVLMGDHRRMDQIKPTEKFDSDDYFTIQRLKEGLKQLSGYEFFYLDDHQTLIEDLISLKKEINFVFNLCDEGFNNDPFLELHIPALLELLKIPYTGGDPRCLAYCYDKSLVRNCAQELGIAIPKGVLLSKWDKAALLSKLDFPILLKPNFGDSSFCITKENLCLTVDQCQEILLKVQNRLLKIRRQYEGLQNDLPLLSVLFEEYLPGKDITIGVLGNLSQSFKILPMIEEDYSGLPADLPKICGYEAKWEKASPYFQQIKSKEVKFDRKTENYLEQSCVKLFSRLGCRDYARFDWRLDSNGQPRLLEANPNPGWCWDGHLARMAEFSKISYPEMLHRILQSAEQRIFNPALNKEQVAFSV